MMPIPWVRILIMRGPLSPFGRLNTALCCMLEISMLFRSGWEAQVVTAARRRSGPAAAREPIGGVLASWAERSGRRRAADPCRGRLRFAFYGRVSTEDYQDPVTSRARQVGQAAGLVAGHGRIVAEFFDSGQSRVLPWARRPQAAALLAALADPGGASTRS
jgi:hypothetical protein